MTPGLNDRTCMKCGAKLTQFDIGLHKKLINRGAMEFMCIGCLAKKFKVTVERLEQKIEEYRSWGCTLFPPKDDK